MIPLEQAARQKLTELSSVMESEKSQGSVLKAIMHAKEANVIDGIYGRMGDLGAIDGEHIRATFKTSSCSLLYYCFIC